MTIMMNDVYNFISDLSRTIELSLNATVKICYNVSCMYKEEWSRLPLDFDLLSEALRSENLKETAHSRILYKLLQYRDFRNSFIQYFLPDVDCSFDTIQIPFPDKNRIDLTIKGDTFFLIVENKVNHAPEQECQIDRYVKMAQQTYPDEQIYVLYLGGESNVLPSEYSMSFETGRLFDGRIICKNFKDDITPWVASIYESIGFDEQPFLKSALLSYKTYLENKYNVNSQYKEMNNKLDKTLIETLGLESASLSEKISVIQDQIDNIDKIRERLSYLLQEYINQSDEQDIRLWYNECVQILSRKPSLTMEDNMEFGFNFVYRNTEFRCCVSFDDNIDPYWGIKGIMDDINSRPKIFESLQRAVIQSNKGFHNCENNTKEWVVSDYERKEIIVERFVTLTQLICSSEACSIIE